MNKPADQENKKFKNKTKKRSRPKIKTETIGDRLPPAMIEQLKNTFGTLIRNS